MVLLCFMDGEWRGNHSVHSIEMITFPVSQYSCVGNLFPIISGCGLSALLNMLYCCDCGSPVVRITSGGCGGGLYCIIIPFGFHHTLLISMKLYEWPPIHPIYTQFYSIIISYLSVAFRSPALRLAGRR